MKKLISRKQRSARVVSRRKFGLQMEALEQRTMLAVTAANDTYNAVEGLGFATGLEAVIPRASTGGWQYYDELLNSTNAYPNAGQASPWYTRGYNPAAAGGWDGLTAPGANAPLGFGGINAFTTRTTISAPPATETTVLFRRPFTLTPAQAAQGAGSLNFVCDDGCVIYLNDVEIHRENLPAAPTAITPTTFADDATQTEDFYINIPLNFAALGVTLSPDGNNLLAIEVHQNNTTSSDLGVDAELLVTGGPTGTRGNDSATAPNLPANLRTYYYNTADPDPVAAQRTTGLVYDTNAATNNSPVGSVTIDPVTGEFTYTPTNRQFNGTASFEYILLDSATQEGTSATVTINVSAVNVPPTGVADTYLGVEGQSFTITNPGAGTEYISRGERWFFKDDGTDQTAAMTNGAFDPFGAGWFSGPAELGYGDGDEQMLLNAPTDHPATYFVKKFTIPDAIPNLLRIGIKRDDGAVVYINGIEVLRDNMPAGAVNNLVYAAGNTTSETQYFEHIVSTAGLGLVANQEATIAVSVHQQSATSSDVSFDLFMDATVAPMIDAGSAWFYLDDGTDQTANISNPAFNPGVGGANWASGNAQLGFGDGDEVTPINGPAHTTYYFAKNFDLTTATVPSTLLVELLRDDGAIVRINGIEVVRDNMPTGPVDNTTFAAADAGSETTFFQHFISTAGLNLQQTGNLITVEVHQVNAGSSDVSFDLRLQARSRVGFLGNDPRDADGDTVTVASVDTTGFDLGTIAFNPNGTFTFNAAAGRSGTDTFTYRLTDGTDLSAPVTVTVTLTPVDDGPVVAVNDSGPLYTTQEDVALVIGANVPQGSGIGVGVLSNDTTHPNDVFDPVTIRVVRQPSNGVVTVDAAVPGGFTYTPNANYNGPDSFDYVANDGFTDSNAATVSITVTPVDDAPVLVNDQYQILAGTSLNASGAGLIARGSSWSYLDELEVTENYPLDGTGNAWNTVAFNTATSDALIGTWKTGNGPFEQGTINAFNPVGSAVTTLGGTALTHATYLFRKTFNLAAGTAAGITALAAEFVADDAAVVFINGTEVARYNFAADVGSLTPASYNGPAGAGGAAGNEDAYTLSIIPISAGLLHDGMNTIAVELHQSGDGSTDAGFDMSLAVAPGAGVLFNDFDPEGDPVTGAAVSGAGPANAQSFTLNANGTFTYTPAAGFTGTDTFQYTVTGQTTPATVTITVSSLPPVANDDVYSTPAGTTLFVIDPAQGVLGNDTPGDLPTDVLVDPAAVGDQIVLPEGTLSWLAVNPSGADRRSDGTFAFDPAPGFQGQVNYVYTIIDGDGDTDTATLTINVGLSFDLDDDGDIDRGDLAIIVGNLGLDSGATNAQGDVTGDGRVSLADVMAMRNRLGSAPPSPAAAVVARAPDARAVDQAVTRLTDVRTRLDAREAAPRAQARVREIVRQRVADARSNAGEAIDSALSAIRARRSAGQTRVASIVDQMFNS